MYLIAVLMSTIGGLTGYIVKLEAKADDERRRNEAIHSNCQAELRRADKLLTNYLLRQDSINKAHDYAIYQVKRKK